jgi:hypothetical protein
VTAAAVGRVEAATEAAALMAAAVMEEVMAPVMEEATAPVMAEAAVRVKLVAAAATALATAPPPTLVLAPMRRLSGPPRTPGPAASSAVSWDAPNCGRKIIGNLQTAGLQ